MYDINDFLNYATDGNSQSPVRKTTRKAPSLSHKIVDTSGNLSTSQPARMALSSGPVMVKAYQPETQTIPVQPSKPALELVNYSERSFAIFGDTKPIKDQLEELGGTFNRWLKKDGIPTPGFIFSNKRLQTVRTALNL